MIISATYISNVILVLYQWSVMLVLYKWYVMSVLHQTCVILVLYLWSMMSVLYGCDVCRWGYPPTRTGPACSGSLPQTTMTSASVCTLSGRSLQVRQWAWRSASPVTRKSSTRSKVWSYCYLLTKNVAFNI